MSNNFKKYQELIKDTVTYIDQIRGPKKKLVPKKEEKKILSKPLDQTPFSTIEKEKQHPVEKPSLQKKTSITNDPFLEKLKKLILTKASYIKLVDFIPDDSLAKQNATLWKINLSIALFSFNNSPEELDFLKSLAKAINHSLPISPKLLNVERFSKEKKWDTFFTTSKFNWIICFKNTLSKFPEMRSFLKQDDKTNQVYLGNIPTILLAPVKQYQKEAHLKLNLWKMIQKIAQL